MKTLTSITTHLSETLPRPRPPTRSLTIGILLGGLLACLGLMYVALSASTAQASSGHCRLNDLQGTYSFDAVGYAPAPPDGLMQDPDGNVLVPQVNFSDMSDTVIPLHAIGHFYFDGRGSVRGYVHENVGGVFEESVPSVGTYSIEPGVGGIGCQGEWILQDDHRVFPFSEEAQHHFRITLAPKSNGFHFIHERLGDSGQATLSGWAALAEK